MSKLVSVVIPTFNPNQRFFVPAVDSILKQSYSNLEVIIVDDSTDPSAIRLIREYSETDPRIRLIHHTGRMGISESLNHGIQVSKGEYVFRMDDDDISLKNRIQYQLEYMEKHPDIDILGARAILFGRRRGIYKVPLKDQDIRCTLLIHNPIVHPSVVFRKSSIVKYGIKYETCKQAEDYRLWSTCFVKYPSVKFANTDRVLLKYRIHAGQLTSSQRAEINASHEIIWKDLLNSYGIDLDDREMEIYMNAVNGSKKLELDEFLFLDTVFDKLMCNNLRLKLVEPLSLNQLLNKTFNVICFHQYYYKGNKEVEKLLKCPVKLNITRNWYIKPFSFVHLLTGKMAGFIKEIKSARRQAQ